MKNRPSTDARELSGTVPFAGASGAIGKLLPDGRAHFQHGPIDLIIGVWGSEAAVAQAVRSAWARFDCVLHELTAELDLLRAPLDPGERGPPACHSSIARRMVSACRPFARAFITPMAAVAGAVADEIVAVMTQAAPLERAYVNNGGDIAVHLDAGVRLMLGVVADSLRPGLAAQVELAAHLPIRGVATSGWRGRSFSLGIADAVTVFARDAASADAAATMIGNAVDVDHPAVHRRPANTLKDDTDLGARMVTVEVGPLDRATIDVALGRGADYAARLVDQGLIVGAGLFLQQHVRTIGAMPRPAITR